MYKYNDISHVLYCVTVLKGKVFNSQLCWLQSGAAQSTAPPRGLTRCRAKMHAPYGRGQKK
jgi:hypothetical protein